MQNNVGLQTAYWSGTTPALDIHQIIELTKKGEYGYDRIKSRRFCSIDNRRTEQHLEKKSKMQDFLLRSMEQV